MTTLEFIQKQRDKAQQNLIRAMGKPGTPYEEIQAWKGCEQTCPDYCPYDDGLMPPSECKKYISYRVDTRAAPRGDRSTHEVHLPSNVRRYIKN